MPRTEAGRRRCAIYTRKSSEEGLEQEFNSLAAQREACDGDAIKSGACILDHPTMSDSLEKASEDWRGCGSVCGCRGLRQVCHADAECHLRRAVRRDLFSRIAGAASADGRVDRVMLRDRKFADSSLEGAGFELLVPPSKRTAVSVWSRCASAAQGVKPGADRSFR
jgi:hypothetical protein